MIIPYKNTINYVYIVWMRQRKILIRMINGSLYSFLHFYSQMINSLWMFYNIINKIVLALELVGVLKTMRAMKLKTRFDIEAESVFILLIWNNALDENKMNLLVLDSFMSSSVWTCIRSFGLDYRMKWSNVYLIRLMNTTKSFDNCRD